ncbi:aldo/keto reductase [Arthrobacter livingstonensis]|uniref:Aldo/keto reductase n=1 Tax=Arthrobacter livingstonensis TaxID=670078 RepID=A0A2V5LCF5_9MICC|nr:aldo/keto reductase [Arthrobacter livingstonensis]PYI67493.1 aldo/keto reductase [Arthrobacter livingstonensis]
MATTTKQPPGPPAGAALAGRSIARIGYGAMQLERHHADPAAGAEVLRRAIELGVNHIDTAHFYGDGFVNGLVRRAVGDADVLVASKVGAAPDPNGTLPLRPAQRPEELRAGVEDNLRSLGVDTIPIVYLRRLEVGPGLAAQGGQVVDIDDQLAEMTAMRDEGKIGAIGLSAVTTDTLRHALPAGIACVQNPYNLLDRRFEDALSLCREHEIGWVPFFPLGSAFPGMAKVAEEPAVREAASRAGVTASQLGLAWLLRHAENVFIIPGTGNTVHLEENMAAGGIELDAVTRATLDAVGAASVSAPVLAPSWPSGTGSD